MVLTKILFLNCLISDLNTFCCLLCLYEKISFPLLLSISISHFNVSLLTWFEIGYHCWTCKFVFTSTSNMLLSSLKFAPSAQLELLLSWSCISLPPMYLPTTSNPPFFALTHLRNKNGHFLMLYIHKILKTLSLYVT